MVNGGDEDPVIQSVQGGNIAEDVVNSKDVADAAVDTNAARVVQLGEFKNFQQSFLKVLRT